MSIQEIQSNEPVTIVVQHEVEPQYEIEFKSITDEFTQVTREFPGFSGKHVLHTTLANKTIYYIFIRFDNLQHLKQWEESDIRQKLLAKLDTLLKRQPSYHYLTGLESWFALGTNKPIIPPPRYKMVLLTWLSVYCLLLLVFTTFGSFLMNLSLPIRFLLSSGVMVLLMTYLVMPLLTRLLVKWLYPSLASKSNRVDNVHL